MTPLILSLLFAFIFFFIQHSCIFSPICSSYAGHGSGLQYISGRNIAKFQMHCVVFLFGCDSSRLHSNGLYSELLGPHLYYHAAMWWVKRKHWCWTDTHIHVNVYGVIHSRDGGIFRDKTLDDKYWPFWKLRLFGTNTFQFWKKKFSAIQVFYWLLKSSTSYIEYRSPPGLLWTIEALLVFYRL